MDLDCFQQSVQGLKIEHPKFDEIFVAFVSFDDEVGDHCYIEDRCLYLVLHVAPNTESMMKVFKQNAPVPII